MSSKHSHISTCFYGLIDGARDLDLAMTAASAFDLTIRSLIPGEAGAALAEVAPYMVEIDSCVDFLETWREHIGNHQGILLLSDEEPDTIYEHLQNIFVACGPDCREFFFRYYDPRVLRDYLPTCNASDCEVLMGPMDAVIAENETADGWLCYTRGEDGPITRELALDEPFITRVAL